MTQDELKQKVAQAAMAYVQGVPVIGVGTGSTVKYFINYLAEMKSQIEGTVSSSEGTTKLLKEAGIPVLDLNDAGIIEVYVDGADEINPNKQLIKGGGAALTREKIIAAASKKFVCIADGSKRVDVLGSFPLPIEVIPMARSNVARAMEELGGRPVWRESCVTDNGNHIVDVHGLHITDPVKMEQTINNITGVVAVGIFAMRPADICLVSDGEQIITF
ncbi:MAG: ribose-5-phosphate isomerase RpiA [Gammaproteobacteria bacterium]|nr:ribose-5-phosphate isomerase RpiA [Gammaproteobacteria bacterium]